jgi:hypothetical protein
MDGRQTMLLSTKGKWHIHCLPNWQTYTIKTHYKENSSSWIIHILDDGLTSILSLIFISTFSTSAMHKNTFQKHSRKPALKRCVVLCNVTAEKIPNTYKWKNSSRLRCTSELHLHLLHTFLILSWKVCIHMLTSVSDNRLTFLPVLQLCGLIFIIL